MHKQSAGATWGTLEHPTCPHIAGRCDMKPLEAAEGETRCSGASQMDDARVIEWAQQFLQTASLAVLDEKEILSDPKVVWALLTEGQGRGQAEVHAFWQHDMGEVNVQKKPWFHCLQQSNTLVSLADFAWWKMSPQSKQRPVQLTAFPLWRLEEEPRSSLH